MPDPIAPAPTPESALAVAPVAEAPAPTPDISPAPDVAPAAAVETQAPAQAEAQPAEPAKPVTPVQSLISESQEKAPEPEKPQAPEAIETAPAEAPPAVTFSDFTLPEGVTLDSAALDQFKAVLGENLPHQDRGQRLIDMHIAEIQRRDQMLAEHQVNVWNTTQAEWQAEVKSDPEIGGNRFNTTMQTCISAVNRFGGTPEQRNALLQALDYTGAGNNPHIIRLINNMATALKEGTPVVQSAAPKPPQTRAQRRYNASGAN